MERTSQFDGHNVFNLKRPCAHCPFRTDIDPFITGARARDIATSLAQDASFPCHETVEHDDDGERVYSRNEQHCAGAAIVLLKTGRPNQMMRIGMRTGWNPDCMQMDAPVYESLGSFVARHAKFSRTSRLPARLTTGNRSRKLPSRRKSNSQETHDMFQDSDSFRCNLRLKPHERKIVEKAAKASNNEKVATFAKRVVLEAATKLVGPVGETKKPVKKAVKKSAAKKPVKKKVAANA